MVYKLLVRRKSFDKVGYLNESPDVNHLFEWYPRATHAGLQLHPIPETVLYRRVHAQNMTRVNRNSVIKGYMGALRSRLDQQRGNPDSNG